MIHIIPNSKIRKPSLDPTKQEETFVLEKSQGALSLLEYVNEPQKAFGITGAAIEIIRKDMETMKSLSKK